VVSGILVVNVGVGAPSKGRRKVVCGKRVFVE